MTQLEKRGSRISIIATCVFFILFFVLSVLIKFKPKNDFKEIKISLATTPVEKTEKVSKIVSDTNAKREEVKKTEESVKKAEPQPETQKTEVKQPKVEPPKKTEEPVKKVESPKQATQQKDTKPVQSKDTKPAESVKKSEPVKKTEQPVSKKEEPKKTTPAFEEPALKKSVEDLMKEQSQKKKKTVNWDEIDFGEDTVESASSANVQKKTAAKSSLSGTAGETASSSLSDSVSATSDNRKKESSSASSSTKAALEGITTATFSSTVSDSVKSRTSVASKQSGDGKVTIQMNNGAMRELLSPRKPVILISEENARLIDSTKEVRIRFTVLSDGTVPFGGISITPSALLPSVIQNEIKDQLKDWRFSKDPSGLDAIAVFDYTIQVN